MSGIVLSRRLVLEESVSISDDAGGTSETWQTLGVLWADVKGRGSKIRSSGGGDVAVERFKIIVRAAPNESKMHPKPDQRFLDGSRTYIIDSVFPHDARGLYLECWSKYEVAS